MLDNTSKQETSADAKDGSKCPTLTVCSNEVESKDMYIGCTNIRKQLVDLNSSVRNLEQVL